MTKTDLGGDLLISGLGLVGLVVVLFFVFSGLEPRAAQRTDAPVVGQTEYVASIARRRTVGTMVWNDLQRGREVFEGDAVFVGPSSATTIRMADGSILEVDENTLVVVTAGEGDTTIDVKEGSVGGHGPMVVRGAAGSVTFREGTRGRVLVSPNGDTRVQISEGVADLSAGDGSANEMSAGQMIDVDGDGVGELIRMDIQLTEPSAGKVVFIPAEEASVDFGWVTSESEGKFTMEVAFDPRFERLAGRVAGKAMEASQALSPGVYYWRVSRGDSISETRRVTVFHDEPPVLYRPRADQEYAIGDTPAVAWTRIGGIRDYELRVEKRYGGGEEMHLVEGQTWQRLRLDPGAWCARVRTKRGEAGQAPWSEQRCFLVLGKNRLPPPNLHKPTLDSKKDG